MAGLALFTLSMWSFTQITHDWGWRELLLPQALRGFAQQLSVAPAVTLTLGGLAPDRLKFASGLFNLMRNLGGAIGIAGCATLLNDRTNLHFLRLAEHLNSTNAAMVDMMTRTAGAASALTGADNIRGHAIALNQLRSLTMREAQTETYADVFWTIMICFAVTTLLVTLMRKVAAPAGPVADAH